MSELVNGPEQLNLSFDAEERGVNVAKIFAFEDHRRQRIQVTKMIESQEGTSTEEISKALERQILDEVLAEAEKLPWYK